MRLVKMLGGGRSALGYTVIEVLIFLAVSGALLVSAAALISGRQDRTRFSQSFDELTLNLEDILNDVSTGYYPSNNDINCTSPSNNVTIVNGVKSQGSNGGCIFSGKLISFVNDSVNYTVYTVVSPQAATTFTSNTNELMGIGSNAGIKSDFQNQASLKVKSVYIYDPNNPTTGAVATKSLIFASNFNAASSGASGNGTKTILYTYDATPTGEVVDPTKVLQLNSDKYIAICLAQDGNTNRVGYVSISPQLSVERVIGSKEGSPC